MQEKNNKEEDFDALNDALDGFNTDPLNLTNEDKKNEDEEEDPETAAKIKAEFESIMGGIKNMSSDDDILNNLTGMLSGIMSSVGQQLGEEGGQQDFKKSFDDFFGGLKTDNVEDAAEKLLGQFMDKDLLEEPLKETQQNYMDFFKKEEGKIPQDDLVRYNKQYDVVLKILETLDQNPNDKTKLIALFEEMQDHGKPPQGIAMSTGMMM